MPQLGRLASDAPTESGLLARYLPFVFAVTIFVSAFLLFGVQPMFTKLVLPDLGGSPAVWSIAMVFFQALLLLGYLYAHLSSRWLSGTQAIIVHAVLILAALTSLPLAVSASFGSPPESGQALWLMAVFAVSVGLPFFVLAATAPLLQSWFARSGHIRSGNPYALYVASNLGSFFALLSYPLLIEPMLPLKAQTAAWAVLFMALGLCLVGCGVLSVWRKAWDSEDTVLIARPSASGTGVSGVAVTDSKVTWTDRMLWTGLAAVPSGLLVSVTAHLSTDVASAPLFWVLPLALFMLTFILAFRENLVMPEATIVSAFTRVTPFIILSLVGLILPLTIQFIAHLGGFFLAAMICHRNLYNRRPAPEHLTEFYLWMSFGGMLGGLFTGLLAPLLFVTILEYRILVIATLLCLPMTVGAPSYLKQFGVAGFGLLIGLLMVLIVPTIEAWNKDIVQALCVCLGAGFLAIIILNRSGPVANMGAAIAAFLIMSPIGNARHEVATRSFFGVNYVKTDPTGQLRLLMHGSTIHGAYRLADLEGKPMTGRPEPTTYYHEAGAINVALQAARARQGDRPASVAVLGLGAGSLACRSEAGENWIYFEIDKEVVKLAQREDLFPFLSQCTPDARIVIGDARLTLQKEAVKYDIIILDAFSSDAIPAHLLTREAFAIYAGKLNPGGTIIAHVSNRYMDIRSVAEAAGVEGGFSVASAFLVPDGQEPRAKIQMATPTTVVVMSQKNGVADDLVEEKGWKKPDDAIRRILWTDDYANIIGAVIRQFW
jgi:hypothetical protein